MAGECPIANAPGWPVVFLKDLTSKIGSGATPRGGSETYLDRRTNFALVRSQNVFDRRFDREGLAFITDEQADALKGVILKEGDVLLNITGDGITFGRACAVPKDVLPACVNQHVSIIRVDQTRAHPGYVLSFLTHSGVKSYIEGFNAGGSRRAITKGHIESFQLPLPPLPEQHAIAHILGTLDDKIELNRRRNQTLEAMARALFKDWFVDFGPVRARMEGCDPYLPADLWQLFPDRLDDEGKPEDWEMVPASELIEFNPTEALRKGTPAPYLDMASLPTSGSWPEPPVIREFGSGMRFRNGDTLLARITPCLENGKTAFVQCLPDDTVGWGSTEYIVMRPKAPVPAGYAYLLARDDAFREHAIRSMTGTSGRQRAQGDSVAAFRVATPPDEKVWHAFTMQITPIFESIKSHEKASETLSVLRDTLLPKLISGDLRVKDAETFLERVA